MLTEGEKQDKRTLQEILAGVNEIRGLVREIKLWRKFVAWAFGIVTVALALADFFGKLKELFR